MKIIISGGGTGGHIYPAITIADEIKKRNRESNILFVGAKNRMEMDRVPKAGYKIIGLWISGIRRKWSLKNLVVPIKIMVSLLHAAWILRRFKPDIVIGVGGFASGPMLRMASIFRIPTLIQEQNSFAGLTNRLLAKHVSRICVAYSNMERYFPAQKLVKTGNPIRENLIIDQGELLRARQHFGWKVRRKTILLIGGSLGAQSLNDTMIAHTDALQCRPDVMWIWQSGQLYFEKLKGTKTANLENVSCLPFIVNINWAYAIADVIVARAGAMTISELSLVGKPVILVPSPNVAEDHQTKNAQALVSQSAALLIDDFNVKQELINSAFQLLDDEKRKMELKNNLAKYAKPRATKLIVDEIENLIEKEIYLKPDENV